MVKGGITINFTLYETVWYFIIYAFFGWCLEVVYQAVEHGKFINRGFLNGPYCPIYGFGVMIVAASLEPLKNDIVILYVGSVVLTSALELVTGFLLEKIFHEHWWDYSEEKFNLGGYICLKFSLLWGVACLVVVRLIFPMTESFVAHIPHTLGVILICVIMAGFVSDLVITVLAIVNIKRRIVLLDDISGQMRKISDATGERLFEGVESFMSAKNEFSEKSAELRERYDEKSAENRRKYERWSAEQKAKYEELVARYKAIAEKRTIVSRRISKAFPKLKLGGEKSFREQYKELEHRLKNKNK